MTSVTSVLAGLVVVLPAVFTTDLRLDALARGTALGLAAIALFGRHRLPPWPGQDRAARLLGLALVCFLVAFAVAVLYGGPVVTGLWGAPRRLNGLLTYAAGVAVLAGIVRGRAVIAMDTVLRAWAAGAAILAVLALVEWAGWHGYGLRTDEFAELAGTLTNPNFAAMYFGMSLPIVWWNVGHARRRPVALAGAACVVTALILTLALQGVLAAAAGLLPAARCWLAARPPATRRVLLRAGVPAAVLAAAVALPGLAAARGPLASLYAAGNVESRLVDWTAAWRMFAAHPVTGVGPGQFAWHYGATRPGHEIAEFGWELLSDHAHSVPVDLLASGGLPLALGWLLVIGAIGFMLWRGLRTLRGEDQALLAAAGGAWLAYQVTALISIDDVSVAGLQWVAAGIVVALALRAGEGEPGHLPAGPPARRALLARLLSNALAAVLVLVLAGHVVGGHDGATGEVAGATALASARRFGPRWGDVLRSRGEALLEEGENEDALVSFRRALAVQPRDHLAVLGGARALAVLDARSAAAWFEEFLRLEPHGYGPALEYAELLMDQPDGPRRARELAQGVLHSPLAATADHELAQRLCRRLGCVDGPGSPPR